MPMRKVVRTNSGGRGALEEGKWYPLARKVRHTCCKCGLKHRWEFKMVKGEVYMRGWLD
jgi:hypothetical protein